MVPSLSHVALLVRSAERAADACRRSGYEIGPIEDFPSEGTREVYVGPPGSDGLLLLMEAIGPGPYRTALQKRGPGLHHVAVDVDSVDDYVGGLSGSGWLLHPASLRTLPSRQTVYLARPGLRVLIEVQQRSGSAASERNGSFISQVFVDGDPEHGRLLDALGVPGIGLAGTDGAGVGVGGVRVVPSGW